MCVWGTGRECDFLPTAHAAPALRHGLWRFTGTSRSVLLFLFQLVSLPSSTAVLPADQPHGLPGLHQVWIGFVMSAFMAAYATASPLGSWLFQQMPRVEAPLRTIDQQPALPVCSMI